MLSEPLRRPPWLDGMELVAVQERHQESSVYRVSNDGTVVGYLKIASSLNDELERLQWLATQGLEVPKVDRFERREDLDYMLTTPIRGTPLSSFALDAVEAARLAGAALRKFHAIPADGCPFDASIDVLLRQARERVTSNVVQEHLFEAEFVGVTPSALLMRLEHLRPACEGRDVTHGDAHPDNILLIREGDFGFVDVGRVGVSDPYRDLAVTTRYFARRAGLNPVQEFLQTYGVLTIDEERLRFYRMLDEFF